MRAVTPKGIEMQDQDIRPRARHRGARSLVDVWAGSRLALGLEGADAQPVFARIADEGE